MQSVRLCSAVKPAVEMHFSRADSDAAGTQIKQRLHWLYWTVRFYEDDGDASSDTWLDKLRLDTVLTLSNAALINL